MNNIEDILQDNINLNHLSTSKAMWLDKQPEFQTFPIHTKNANPVKLMILTEKVSQQEGMNLEDAAEWDMMCGTTFITLGLN